MEELVSRPEWQLACRIAASKGLSKSERLPRFLLYICELYLLGRAHEITEQRIGIQIFNRSVDYNPGEDNIVRSYARLLRKRLDIFFQGEGAGERLRIVIPRGGYVPVFEENLASFEPDSPAEPDSHEIQHSEHSDLVPLIVGTTEAERSETVLVVPRHTSAWRSSLLAFAAGVLLACLSLLVVQAIQARRDLEPSHALWLQMFQGNRNTLWSFPRIADSESCRI